MGTVHVHETVDIRMKALSNYRPRATLPADIRLVHSKVQSLTKLIRTADPSQRRPSQASSGPRDKEESTPERKAKS